MPPLCPLFLTCSRHVRLSDLFVYTRLLYTPTYPCLPCCSPARTSTLPLHSLYPLQTPLRALWCRLLPGYRGLGFKGQVPHHAGGPAGSAETRRRVTRVVPVDSAYFAPSAPDSSRDASCQWHALRCTHVTRMRTGRGRGRGRESRIQPGKNRGSGIVVSGILVGASWSASLLSLWLPRPFAVKAVQPSPPSGDRMSSAEDMEPKSHQPVVSESHPPSVLSQHHGFT